MCVTLALAAGATLLSGASTFVSSSVNSYVENQQLKMDIEVEKARAAGQMADRWSEYARMSAANLVSVSAAGYGFNMSFQEGVSRENLRETGRDVGRIGFNRDMEVARKKYGIAVNKIRPYLDAGVAMASTASSLAGGYAGSAAPAAGKLNVTRAGPVNIVPKGY